jgi:hypothetical protein
MRGNLTLTLVSTCNIYRDCGLKASITTGMALADLA